MTLLPRDELLWQMHVFTGLPGGRVALYFKTHHGLMDGIGFIRVFTGIVSSPASQRRAHAIWEGMLAVPPLEGHEARPAAATPTLLGIAGEARRIANDMARLAWHQGLRGLGIGRGLAAHLRQHAERAEDTAQRQPGARALRAVACDREAGRETRRGEGQ